MKTIRLITLALITTATFGGAGAQAAALEANSAAAPGAAPAEASTPVVRRIPDTLMFSIDELNDIQSRMASGSQGGDSAGRDSGSIENATLYLSTILYSGPNDWTIWVNGKPIGPDQDFQSFEITAIGPRFVELLVPLSAQGMRPVRLEPNQTFIAKTGAIVEGAWTQ